MSKVSAEGETKKKKSYEEKRAEKAALKTEGKPHKTSVETPEVEANLTTEVQPTKVTKVEVSTSRGKKYKAARLKVENKAYSLAEAVKLVGETSYTSFAGSVELHIVLTEGTINTRVELPNSTGITRKIEVADDKTVEKLKSGKIDFDVLITTPAMMPKLVPFAKLLGPRGMMPNPKNGTVVEDPEKAIAAFSGNTITIKTEKSAPLIHLVIAKTNQEAKEIEENYTAVIEAIGEKRIKKAVLSPSMGPGIQVVIA